ncbi:MAG: hypothetical protein PHE89_04795 [Alphaproteobacteria bacterium]|nr:hypothetical protein [Alphaproteobacteria bacterium]
MQYSIVNYSEILEALDKRIDAEYWHPEAVEFEQRINGSPLNKFIKHGYRVVYENTKIIDKEIGNKENLPLFVQASDIEGFCINLDSVNCVSNDDWLKYTNGRVLKGELLVEVKGNVKKVAIVTDDIPDKTLISGTLYKLSIENINKFFVLNFLSCKYGQRLKDRLVCNIATPFINKEGLFTIPIPDMTFLFQAIIEKIYKESLFLKNKSKFLYQQAEDLLLAELGLKDWKPKHQLSFVKSFSDAQSSDRIDAEYYQPKYDEIIAKIKAYSNGFDSLQDIVKIKKGIEIGSEAYQEEGIPFVRVSNLNKFEISENNQQYLSEKDYEYLAQNYQPKKDEILLSKDGTAGLAYHLNENPKKMITSGGLLRLQMNNKEYLPEYLTLVLNSLIVQQQIEQVISGAIIKHWLVDQVNNTLIPKLEIEKQKELVVKIQESFKAREQSKKLLEIAKRGVEIAIEQDETTATTWINAEVSKIGVSL